LKNEFRHFAHRSILFGLDPTPVPFEPQTLRNAATYLKYIRKAPVTAYVDLPKMAVQTSPFPVKMGGENLSNCNNSAKHRPISLKLATLVRCESAESAKRIKSTFGQIQDGGRRSN